MVDSFRRSIYKSLTYFYCNLRVFVLPYSRQTNKLLQFGKETREKFSVAHAARVGGISFSQNAFELFLCYPSLRGNPIRWRGAALGQ
jgi:hypothetical protein